MASSWLPVPRSAGGADGICFMSTITDLGGYFSSHPFYSFDVANEMRKLAAERDRAFAISERVYQDAGLMPVHDDQATLKGLVGATTVFLSDVAPIASPAWTLHGKLGRGAMLRRLWAGG